MRMFGLLACGVAVAALASTATASPIGGPALQGLTADIGLIQTVHGCHREVRRDRWGWHRHRRDCSRINVPPPDDYDDEYEPRRPCYYVGPIRVCP